jgi:hypothetical protein
VQNTLGGVQQWRRAGRATRQPTALASAAVEWCRLIVHAATIQPSRSGAVSGSIRAMGSTTA